MIKNKVETIMTTSSSSSSEVKNFVSGSGGFVVEESTKVPFTRLSEEDGNKELCAVGVRKRSFLGLVGIKIYAFGIYADFEKLKEVIKPVFEGEANEEVNKKLYEAAIDTDVAMTIKLVIVFGSLTMHMVRKIFNDNLGASIKKFSSSDHGELLERVLGDSKEDIKLPIGSVILINKLPGYVLQTKVKGEQVSEVKSQLLCKAFFNMYLGDEPIDPKAKVKFGEFLKSNILKT